jgi:DNA repair exonuclease SbcCD nuclease subunit
MEASMPQPTSGKPSLRLLHASDLHLERPIYGLTEVPDHLRKLLIEAPYHAAEQVFEAALTEDVDAVLLAGDVLNVDRAGPPAIMLLLEQFSRLHDRGIPVYWAGGVADLPDHWPRSVTLPDNVHVFPIGRVESLDLVRNGETIARVQGTSCRENGEVDTRGFHRDAHGLFTIGVAHGTSDSAGREGDRVHYMALGGRHAHQTVDHEPGVAHYCGTPQGRGPSEVGPHGATLVHVDDTGRARPQFVATDAVRWTEQTLEVTAPTREEQLSERLFDRMEKLIAKHPGINLLVRWKVEGTGPLVNRLRPGGLADELLTDLRRRFGIGQPLAWSASLECDSPLSVPPEWYDQETVLGDFVRQVRTSAQDEQSPFDVKRFLPGNLQDDELSAIGEIQGPTERDRLITRAAKLGIDLMTLPLEEGELYADA